MSTGEIVVANRQSGTLSVIDVATDVELFEIALPQAEGDAAPEPMYVSYLSETNEVVVGDRANDRLVFFNRSDYSVSSLVSVGQGVFHSWADPDGEQVWVANDIDNTISVVDIQSKQVIETIPLAADLIALGGKVHDVFLDPVTQHAYVSILNIEGDEDVIVKYSRETFAEVDRALVGDGPHISATSTNDVLYVPTEGGDQVVVLDRATLDVVTELTVPGAHGAVGAFDSRTYDYFYTTNLPGGGAGGLYTIDTATNEIVGEPIDTPFPVPHNIALSPESDKLYVTHSGATANQVSVYEVDDNGIPSLTGAVEVGFNPFGLASVALSTDTGGLIQNIRLGTDGADVLAGSHENDNLLGLAGNDILYGNGGRDALSGGKGDDLIYGGSQQDRIWGGEGDDTIFANGGGDWIDGGLGSDTIWLGAGAATIVLKSGEGVDSIKNFQLGSTQFKVSSLSGLSFADSADGARISQGGELLAVVSWQTAATFDANSSEIFVV